MISRRDSINRVPTGEKAMITNKSDLYDRFHQRLTGAGGEAHHVANLAEAAEIIAAHPALAAKEIVVPPQFHLNQPGKTLLPALAQHAITICEAGTPASVADAPAGLSQAEMAIAETGSVLLADNSLEARVVGMLTLTHFVIVSESALVAMLDDAGQLLQRLTRAGPDQSHYISFVTGPSRTADIERTLTIGVQGPKILCVIIVKERGT